MSNTAKPANPPDLTDPNWLPTDTEELQMLDSVARRVAWEKVMAARGIRVLTLGLTPEQEQAAVDSWARQCAVDDNALLIER